jgi:hypothetical protein
VGSHDALHKYIIISKTYNRQVGSAIPTVNLCLSILSTKCKYWTEKYMTKLYETTIQGIEQILFCTIFGGYKNIFGILYNLCRR